MVVEIRDIAPGLWIWRVRHPDWRPDAGWPEAVTATYVESGGQVAVRASCRRCGSCSSCRSST